MEDQYQVLLDVKLDVKERKHELWQLRNWFSCITHIQAIKCFPCYIKISFHHKDNTNPEHPFSVIRINIPGIKLEVAASRTKAHTYGVFWKNNRKRCKMFLAFGTRQDCVTHMNWLKSQIDMLEKYRRDILGNHRISRSYANQNKAKVPSAGAASLGDGKENIRINENAENVRDMQDVLGPLPALPFSEEFGGRWSLRRTSGYSGIYEEILDEPDSAQQISRTSITSDIYVVMGTPAEPILQNIEVPPPLPPRRRLQHSNTNPDIDGVKQKRSAWNIIDSVFNRNKRSETLIRHHQKPLYNKHSSFSSPDLTNIVATNATSYNIIDIDDNDLEIMDIERSNSLNSAANQFLCRPPALNISANILWSHNLSRSVYDASTVNLVGANINSDNFLSDDTTGCSQMASMSWKDGVNPKSCTIGVTISEKVIHPAATCRLIEDISGYCQMAPIITGSRSKDTLKKKSETQPKRSVIAEDIVLQSHQPTTDDDGASLLDFSLISNDKHSSSHGSCHDENSSSGVSSDEGAISAKNLRRESINRVKCNMKLDLNTDDAISLTCTESPTSPMIISPLERCSSQFTQKLDDKYPSYYPNNNIYSSPIDIKRPSNIAPRTPKTSSRNLNICCSYNSRRSTFIKTTSKVTPKKSQSKKLKPEDKERPSTELNSFPFKESPNVQKIKTKKALMRGGGIGNGTNAMANYSHAAVVEKPTTDTKSIGIKYKSKTKPIHECTKKHGMSTTETMGSSTLPMKSTKGSTKHNNFGTLPKTSPSPKHLYRKCTSLANRITSPTPSAMSVSPSTTPVGTASPFHVHVSSATMPLSTHGQTSKFSVNHHFASLDGKCAESINPSGGASKGSDITEMIE